MAASMTCPTTLMIKNIPCRCSQQNILDVVKDHGFANDYDFFYLPCRHGAPASKPQNYGYAFINFKTPQLCMQFAERILQGKTTVRQSPKLLTVATAHIQGVKNLAEHFKNSLCVQGATPPMFTDSKVQEDVNRAIQRSIKLKQEKEAMAAMSKSMDQHVDSLVRRTSSPSSGQSTTGTESDGGSEESIWDDATSFTTQLSSLPPPGLPAVTQRRDAVYVKVQGLQRLQSFVAPRFDREPLFIPVDTVYYRDVM